MSRIVAVAIAVIAVLCLILLFTAGVYYSNKEIRLVNKAEAQQKVCKAYFDTMWKTISQKCQIKNDYKKSFGEIYTSIMEGRYSNGRGGSLMSWIQEANPNYDSSLFRELMQTIESMRTSYFLEQKALSVIYNEHKDLIQTWPSSKFVGKRPLLKITIITSTETEKVYESGKEDNIELPN